MAEEKISRETWGGKIEFILSTMGYSVGLGNVWRFPYLCYANGGGAFLIPYFITLAVAAIPVMFLEISFGQFTSLGCISSWKIAPLFKGLGIAMTVVSAYFCLYYNLILAYTIHYMASSFSYPLPWVGCNHSWNTEHCYERSSVEEAGNFNSSNVSMATTMTTYTEEWTTTEVITDLVVYFTATFPYFVLLILFIRGVTLPGSGDGILWFIRPQFEKLKSANVWKSAANQVFLSFGAGWGGIQTLASYNKFNNNCFRDTLFIAITSALTSIFAGFVIFSVIGFMAHDSGLPIEEVVAGGPGLAFIAYPEAIARLWCPQLWSSLFFFMLITLGLDSQFVTLETLITAIIDELDTHKPGMRKYKQRVILITCIIMFLLGLPMVTQGGIYVMTLFDWYSAGFTPMILAIIEVLVISYVYGTKRFMGDISSMLGFTPSSYWRYCWMAITPMIVAVIITFSFIDYTPATLGSYVFPPWAEAIGWTLTMTSVVVVIVYAVIYLICLPTGTLLERFQHAIKPSSDWGPALYENRLTAGYPVNPDAQDKDHFEEKFTNNDESKGEYVALDTFNRNTSV